MKFAGSLIRESVASSMLMESAEVSFGQSTHVYKPRRKSR